MSEITMIPLKDLVLSELNMRHAKTNAQEDKQLKASLVSFGVLQNFLVHPEGKKNAVAAGSRRFRLMKELVAEKKLKPGCLVPCRIVAKERALAMSVAENTTRTDPHPADEFVAFKRMADAGATIKKIAGEFGVGTQKVKQRMSLGAVHPDIITAFRKDKITLQAVEAFTVEPDQEKQLKCFKNVEFPWARNIKDYLLGAGIRSGESIVKFIGLNEYKKAGGKVKQDLFDSASFLIDGELVKKLAEEKLAAALSEEDAKGEGWAWMDFSVKRDLLWNYSHHEAELVLPDDLQAQHDGLKAAADKNHGDDWETEEKTQRALEEFEENQDEHRTYTPEQRSSSGILISIGHGGKLEVHRGLVRGKDRKSADQKSGAGDNNTSKYSQALKDDIGLHRQQAFKAALSRDPDLVFLLMQFRICDELFQLCSSWDHFTDIRSEGHLIPREEDTSANRELNQALPLEWSKPGDIKDRFQAFRQLSKAAIAKLTTYAVLKTVNVGIRGRNEFADAIIDEIQVPFAELYRPTKDDFFSRIRKSQLLDIVGDLVGEDRKVDLAKKKKGELADYLHELIEKHEGSQAAYKSDVGALDADKITSWLPDGF